VCPNNARGFFAEVVAPIIQDAFRLQNMTMTINLHAYTVLGINRDRVPVVDGVVA